MRVPRPASFSAVPAEPEVRRRRLRWAKDLLDRLLPQDLSAEDRVSILCIMLGREVALLPEGEIADGVGFVAAAVAAAAAGTLAHNADRALRTHAVAGHA